MPIARRTSLETRAAKTWQRSKDNNYVTRYSNLITHTIWSG